MTVSITVASLALAQAVTTGTGPRYDSERTQVIIEAMVEAHGGLDRWRAAPTIRYDNIFFNKFAMDEGNPWWIVRETFDQRTRRAAGVDSSSCSQGSKGWCKVCRCSVRINNCAR